MDRQRQIANFIQIQGAAIGRAKPARAAAGQTVMAAGGVTEQLGIGVGGADGTAVYRDKQPGPVAGAVDVPSQQLSANSPRLEYDLHLFSTGEAKVQLVVAPTLGYTPGRGLRCAISLDDEAPQIVDLLADTSLQAWERSVADSVRTVLAAKLKIEHPGKHVLKFFA